MRLDFFIKSSAVLLSVGITYSMRDILV